MDTKTAEKIDTARRRRTEEEQEAAKVLARERAERSEAQQRQWAEADRQEKVAEATAAVTALDAAQTALANLGGEALVRATGGEGAQATYAISRALGAARNQLERLSS